MSDVSAQVCTTVTQKRLARDGEISASMRRVAAQEGLDPEAVRVEVAAGRFVIPANVNHTSLEPMGIGAVARVKINANIGNSTVQSDIENELEKLKVSIRYGADTVMDLSTGGDLNAIRTAIIQACPVPIGTVPIYQATAMVERAEDLTAELLLSVKDENEAGHLSTGFRPETVQFGKPSCISAHQPTLSSDNREADSDTHHQHDNRP